MPTLPALAGLAGTSCPRRGAGRSAGAARPAPPGRLSRAAFTIARLSLIVWPVGFSTKTCAPAFTAAIVGQRVPVVGRGVGGAPGGRPGRAGRPAPPDRPAPRQRHEVPEVRHGRQGRDGPAVRPRRRLGRNARAQQPAARGMDWDLWCGPAPLRPFNGKLHPGGWRNFLDYANGTLGDWGVHWLDQVMWWTARNTPSPSSARPVGPSAAPGPERQRTNDRRARPPGRHLRVRQDFTCTWENRSFAGNAAEKHQHRRVLLRHQGHAPHRLARRLDVLPGEREREAVHEDAKLQEPDGHNIRLLWADFIGAIEARRPGVADIELAHRSSVLPLLGRCRSRSGGASGGTRTASR